MYGEDETCIRGFIGVTLRERDQLEDPGVDGKIILRWNFTKWNIRTWAGSSWLRIGTDGGLL